MSIKILLADDSITIQKVVGIIFGGEEYALTVVDNGKAAIEKARELSPDVLLIDALMPGISGYEVCEAVRATPALANKPILILTGSFEPFDEDKAKTCGADDFLSKPFESQQIVSKVKELYELGLKRSAPPLPTESVKESEQAPEPMQSIATPSTPIAPVETPIAAEPVSEDKADDIWGAFTLNDEPAPIAAPPVEAAFIEPQAAAFEPDAFSIITEEPEAQTFQPAAASATPADTVKTQWIPVDEHTFEFSEETPAESPAVALPDQMQQGEEVSFGEISFEEPIQQPELMQPATEPAPADFEALPSFTGNIDAFTETPEPVWEVPAAPEFETPAPVFAVPEEPAFEIPAAPAFVEPTTPIFEAPPVALTQQPAQPAVTSLTEEQLRAAIAGVSQDVIQRIVWEVVPDLAETLIKEAIRKIKEGM